MCDVLGVVLERQEPSEALRRVRLDPESGGGHHRAEKGHRLAVVQLRRGARGVRDNAHHLLRPHVGCRDLGKLVFGNVAAKHRADVAE